MAQKDFSPLSWQEFFDEKRSVVVDDSEFNVYLKGNTGPLFYLLHGGGYTGLTWACFAEELSKQFECQVMAPDLRGHGESRSNPDEDLSTERQVRDIAEIYNAVYASAAKPPPTFIVGHSMGGALAVHVVHENLIPNVQVLAVIDVVEGSALASLSVMTNILRSRPRTFPTQERAVKWCIGSAMTKNERAARVSMPSQIRPSSNGNEFEWRINLSKTQSNWTGWFKGISKKFLECKPVKVLILAGVDRLDKELLVSLRHALC
ncbi:protein phosphatase methylesterase 1 [Aphelenchoides avenae]|nr:protein phosphatase methylesterase 1 [Aphelenchus avenae]